MKRKTLILFLLVLLIFCYPNTSKAKTANYNENSIGIFRWDNVIDRSVKLTKSNTTIYIESSITSINNRTISGGVYLERYTNGRWVNVASWAIRGSGSVILSDSYKGASGELYRARLSADVGGERISATSNSVRL